MAHIATSEIASLAGLSLCWLPEESWHSLSAPLTDPHPRLAEMLAKRGQRPRTAVWISLAFGFCSLLPRAAFYNKDAVFCFE